MLPIQADSCDTPLAGICSTTSAITYVTINCNSNISDEYSVTLHPGGMSQVADSGVDITFTDLDPDTTYTYTATLMGVNNTEYTVTSTVTTSNYLIILYSVHCKIWCSKN